LNARRIEEAETFMDANDGSGDVQSVFAALAG